MPFGRPVIQTPLRPSLKIGGRLLRLLETTSPQLLPDRLHQIRKRVRATSEPPPNHIRTTSEPYPNCIRTASEPHPNSIRTAWQKLREKWFPAVQSLKKNQGKLYLLPKSLLCGPYFFRSGARRCMAKPFQPSQTLRLWKLVVKYLVKFCRSSFLRKRSSKVPFLPNPKNLFGLFL